MPKPASACMHTILRLTSAYPKFGHCMKLNFFVYICVFSLVSSSETLYAVICAGSISCHAVNMLSLCVYYNLYATLHQVKKSW